MPRYLVRLSSSQDSHLHVSQHIYAKGDDEAVAWAAKLLRAKRLTSHRTRAWDRWSVSVGLSPYITPRVIATGQATGD